ncbi:MULTISPECIES: hypothetical protein [Streptomyces]|uniref:hypothetical protein n=1 Tax=Streptomyces TaxID=1883 RepID=UPI00144AF03D|nr:MULTISPECIES: hypothetical protein [unclassified Streptomyces]MBJ6623048.1 hypothetical protein [Streptomyces sp. DHE17-7]
MPTPEEDHRAVVAATARHIQDVVSVLRELDFGDTPPAAVFDAAASDTVREEGHRAAV